jgi:hypothetical protein
MFFPMLRGRRGPGRSLVVFTAGRGGLENIDSLVRKWGFEHFDYVIAHFDESMEEYQKLDWYQKAVGYYTHRQGKVRALDRVPIHVMQCCVVLTH